MNVSFDGSSVTIRSDSRFLILADVAALEGLSAIASSPPSLGQLDFASLAKLLTTARSGFTVYLHDLGAVPNAPFQFSCDDLEAADDDDPAAATVDTGALVVMDASKLPVICAALTWDAYDFALQDAGTARFDAITAKVGGPYFAILHGDADAQHCFHGDGAYRIRKSKKA